MGQALRQVMFITKIEGAECFAVANALWEAIQRHSRFTATVSSRNHYRYNECIEIRNVRLIKAKPYCGNHPNACVVTFREKRHNKSKFLEGADWVEFNDFVNDQLDALNASADVFSSPQEVRGLLWIRRGTKRRLRYESKPIFGGFGVLGHVWLNGRVGEELFEDWRLKESPRSEFPDGTPGQYAAINYEHAS